MLPDMANAQRSTGIGSLDGKTMIQMNNLAVGYFPTDCPEIGVYPPPTSQPEPHQPQVPVPVEGTPETSF